MNGEWFEIFRISLKATYQEALTFICFTVLIFLNILAFQYFFPAILKIIASGWGFSMIFLLDGRTFAVSLCPGGGEFALSKKFPRALPRGGDGHAWN